MSGTSALRTWWAQRPLAAGAAVMATGILSVGLHLTGYEILCRIALVVAGAAWLGLAADVVLRLLRERERFAADAGSPAALASVAATTVLGTQLSVLGLHRLAEALLALAGVLLATLAVLAARHGEHWRRGTSGAVFLGCVATEGIAVLGAVLAAAVGVAWLAHTALVFFWLGLVFYLVGLSCFDLRQVVTGAGDHWLAGGGLAISALAGARLLASGHSGLYLWNNDDNYVLQAITIALFILAVAWCCVLAAAELLRPRPGYDVRRWSTVFPVGMTAVAAVSVATAVGVPWLRGPGQVLLWIAVAVWCMVCAGAVRSALRAFRSTAPR